jgi:hypothetical protein
VNRSEFRNQPAQDSRGGKRPAFGKASIHDLDRFVDYDKIFS